MESLLYDDRASRLAEELKIEGDGRTLRKIY
ncbi:hypothetical protein AZE42_12629 [Rhizopogon vesiculosus]|uniref:Uncharacterized protein n=1 Tax=Rhizopogon vesiculosus TaxID=180088 RepID=A0A1J8QI94_9AGAM|nr:hypothetical protein AZE42_12629 [Rhizopogon vesiculosus]